ncbi:hypothetical protein DFA_00365 [Cavenderia fasciculata]|uniref:Uncharacterized protein n=1 Tax=Cavenderia fasciculata TaxID=261658 RepID=F4PRF2_CACFS|nr:uncharacterized protein DFA_00365 [Cavenderia fasciculata]EGG20504.1 hypothetical protein DFA_00365 [Cavenderia fasciculata]|eukprot:XP_004358354.1 hypothetical protein DFA_00365 [Cavenderia fasciculata]
MKEKQDPPLKVILLYTFILYSQSEPNDELQKRKSNENLTSFGAKFANW